MVVSNGPWFKLAQWFCVEVTKVQLFSQCPNHRCQRCERRLQEVWAWLAVARSCGRGGQEFSQGSGVRLLMWLFLRMQATESKLHYAQLCHNLTVMCECDYLPSSDWVNGKRVKRSCYRTPMRIR